MFENKFDDIQTVEKNFSDNFVVWLVVVVIKYFDTLSSFEYQRLTFTIQLHKHFLLNLI